MGWLCLFYAAMYVDYLFLRFFHRLVISSSVLPLVLETSFRTKMAATTKEEKS